MGRINDHYAKLKKSTASKPAQLRLRKNFHLLSIKEQRLIAAIQTLGTRQKQQSSFLNMIYRAIISFLTIFYMTQVVGQTRHLTGKIIGFDFEPFMQTMIFNVDTVELGKSDMTGSFNISVPSDTKTLIIATVGMEWKRLDLTDTCNNLEIILLPRWTHDFKTLKQVDRLRRKDFGKLPKLHKTAFEKGIFISDKPCYVDNFIPIRSK